MSPLRLPLTPSMSGELVIKEQHGIEIVESSFALPPAALEIQTATSAVRTYGPGSPPSPDLAGMGRAPRQAAGAKRPLEEFNLPPPPTRTRKIIQMKPKAASSPKPPASAAKPKDTSKTPANPTSVPNPKKKQPSATSAAGRKIARKTAHSLIERRRRSKMNEEFNTLKNMIPACKGQDMHKLAILQASIDYVNYLEQCIAGLKTAPGRSNGTIASPIPPSPTSPEVIAGAARFGTSSSASSMSPELLPTGDSISHNSPSLSPRNTGFSQPVELTTSILPSPALDPSQSPDAMRSMQHTWRACAQPVSALTSPPVLPQQQAVTSYNGDTDIDHEASAALLMLNMDRRGTMDSSRDVPLSRAPPRPMLSQPPSPHTVIGRTGSGIKEKHKKMGMSVSDLLVS